MTNSRKFIDDTVVDQEVVEDTLEQEVDDLEELVGFKNAIPTGVKPKQ